MKNYHTALKELEKIVEDLERGEVSVDILVSKVRRASELIRQCKGILRDTSEEIEKVIGEMDKEE